jgi:hypothetical protein
MNATAIGMAKTGAVNIIIVVLTTDLIADILNLITYKSTPWIFHVYLTMKNPFYFIG